ncbi:MAG: hypothetical protein A2934_02960 [Candidatus Sungbacteria bacterium RIFCSPLOWO2_01_FULL_47_10]|uniref:Peptidase C39-like domain-containing protein n=1 Tax=Candidatus Sungbacteria bacterium RIFCSPLOWO2_01_FULL_47_10 TaxID=1802276 RepID=A0A1G2L837_9BACT|nr:MAG: hypothetical protein A2934_02960 [Candidatus Sungbacteria bacterium RIFCSPLOWO2_01_FULL_47_10]
MVLKFYGERITLKRAVKEMRIKSSKGVTLGKLGSFFLERGMEATVQAWPSGIPKELRSEKTLRYEDALTALDRCLKNASKNKARTFSKETRAFVKNGGGLILHPHSIDDVRARLEAKAPIIRSIDMKHFLNITRQTGHAIVEYGITGCDSQVTQPYVYVHDPFRGPGKFISVQKMIDACNSWCGMALYVIPKAA